MIFIYLLLSFVITHAPMFIYINELTRRLISERIEVDELEYEYIIDEKKMMIDSSLTDINVIGLRALSYFGLHLSTDDFNFDNLPNFYNCQI